MFGWIRKSRSEQLPTEEEYLKLAREMFDKCHDLLAAYTSLRNNTNASLEEMQQLLAMAKGEPFAALHQWILQSTERERHARSNEKEYIQRWREHVKSLNEQVELLKANAEKPKAGLCIVLREPSGRLWHALMEIDWRYPFPVGTNMKLRLWSAVDVSAKVVQINCVRQIHPPDNTTLSMEIVTEVVDVPEIGEKERELMWRRKYVLSELKAQ